MEFTQSGVPLSFEVTYDSPSLFVGMAVFDDSGASPSLVSLIPMDNFYGNTYRAKFTPSAGKSYLFNKSVYTDGSYDTIDSDYSQGSESIRSEDIASIVLDALLTDHTISGSAGDTLADIQSKINKLAIPSDIVCLVGDEIATTAVFEDQITTIGIVQTDEEII